MKCPKCACQRAKLLDSRGSERRRECEQCGCRYVTRETVFAVVQQRTTTGSNRSADARDSGGAR